ncbi:DNA polymerase III subunit gamma/tau [Fimbriiglobus ruber]|uniref:DNA polymerase III subunit gamma/tau n=1 Tax=Fimbriiglobus ruber TaxID=1908690 RepID=A0A225DC27_9BACT|nr:DNA polymerase III subunit gamma/tau [Fimbriiglobus ruber]OWK34846.1 DNA polymerase III subunits gamma and tau [Fimbriiglobus ruber]
MAKSKSLPPNSPAPPAKDAPQAESAEYTVVARRYRPQQFSDLVGQEHVAKALTNALTSGRVAHAYLFTGARGVGKTSTARILAKALNCVNGPTATPCDVCEICKSIAGGDDTDVIEIDGASNNKVDEIRDLRSNVGFRPQRARYKIYIIDEVHMLSNSAFNALLKTLEEPPAHVKFIFATTEVQKIPVTILSRCQRFDFAAINPTRVFQTLKHIVGKEGLRADDDALHVIARRAAGSMRDAQTLLDQLLGFCDGVLTTEKVHSLLGTAGEDRVADLADAIITKDAKRAIEYVAEVADAGAQLGELLDQLVDYWRGLMLVHVAGPDARDLPGTPSSHERIRRHTSSISLDTVLSGLDILTATKTKLRSGSHIQVLLEVAVIRLSRLEEMLSIAQLTQQVLSGGQLQSAPASNSRPANLTNGSGIATPGLSSTSLSSSGPNGAVSPSKKIS